MLLAGLTAAGAPARPAAGPTASARPAVTGAAVQGAQLAATAGTWSGSGTIRFAYRWYRCDTMGSRCGPLRGATTAHHTLSAADVGHTLAVNVRATDSGGAANGYSSLIGPVAGRPAALTSTVQPAVSGTAALGSVVHVDNGTWSPTPTTYAYQWIRCNANGRACAPIAGATSNEHTIVDRDTAHSLVAIVQARAGDGSAAVLSTATTEIGSASPPPATAPKQTAPAAITSETAQQGKRLTATGGTWSGSGTLRYAYQWYRCDPGGAHCSSIHGATKPTYTQVAKDVGQTIGFAVHATDAGGTSTGYASLVGPVAVANATLVSTAQPTVTGTPQPGQTLQATTGSWSQTPTAFGYQWQRCNANGRLCTSIPGATAATYLLTSADSGHALVAVVQATAGTATQSVWSVASPAIAAAPAGPVASARPTVTGTVQAGKQLTGATGTWSGSGTLRYAYQWYRCDATGAHCSSIHGATKPTYTQVAKDVSKTIGFGVRATDANGTTSAFAGLVGPVAATTTTLVSTGQPTVSGTAHPGQTLQASTGSWSQTPTQLGYQWQRCNANGRVCSTIPGATAATYLVTAGDAGHELVALVEAAAGGITQTTLSAPAGPVA